MPKYEATVTVWVTVEATDDDHAELLVKNEFVDHVLAIGMVYDSPFDVQLEILNIEESE